MPSVGAHRDQRLVYRIHLTVRDSGGLTHSVSRDIIPRTSHDHAGHEARRAAADARRTAAAPHRSTSRAWSASSARSASSSPQTSAARPTSFSSWSDGGARRTTISTPATNTTYTANFTSRRPRGGGLIAEYFDNIDLTNRLVTRVDPTVNFNFGTGSPDPEHRPRHVLGALDRHGDAAVLADLHVLHDQRRRRAAVGERRAGDQQLDRPCAHRKHRHDRA